VRNFGSHIGQALLADEVNGVNFAENWISVDPKVDYDKTVEAIEETVSGYPGMFHNVETYLNESIDEVITGSKETFDVRVYGQDLHTIHALAEQVKDSLNTIPDIESLHIQLQSEVPEIQVKVDLAKAEHYGIKPGDVRRASAAMMAGEEGRRPVPRREGVRRQRLEHATHAQGHRMFRKLPLDTPNHGHVALGEVADVRIRARSERHLPRERSRRIDIGGRRGQQEPRHRHEGGRAARRRDQVPGGIPRRRHRRVRGTPGCAEPADDVRDRRGDRRVPDPAGLVRQPRDSACSGSSHLPSALVGGLIGAYFTGGVISLGSMVGFLTVFGIAARNGILLINHYQHLQQHENEPFGPGLVLRGAMERLSPILMTAAATALALVPLIAAGSIPGHEIEHPMAVVILCGLITSTLLNLFVVPSIYLRFGSHNQAERRAAAV
jgi:Cu/Ag efflux pump CusA